MTQPPVSPSQRRVPLQQGGLGGGIPLFTLFGIDVRLHWLWFVVAYWQISNPVSQYSSLAWNIAEYLSLFGIVLLHEFGHALACRSVGGRAERILLWPLGGVAYVQPPNRPGAVLWSIAAGPLVNVALAPVFIGAYMLLPEAGPQAAALMTDLNQFAWMLMAINIVLLVFNMLPIFPLDGGQILRSLVWFAIGPVKSLLIAAGIGLLAAVGIGVWAAVRQDIWFIVLAAFGGWTSFTSLRNAWQVLQIQRAPRRSDAACPVCRTPPLDVDAWLCRNCGGPVNPWRGPCPRCNYEDPSTQCPECYNETPKQAWYR